MVACAHASRSFPDRRSHCAGAKLSHCAIHLYVVLGHARDETILATLEANNSLGGNVSGEGVAHGFLCGCRPSFRDLRPIILRSAANQVSTHQMG